MSKNHISRTSSPRPSSPPPAYTEQPTERTPLVQRDAVADVEASLADLERQLIRRDITPFLTRLIILSCFLTLSLLLAPSWHAWFASPHKAPPAPTVRDISVVVIGAGPAGISTAYTLAKRFEGRKDVRVNITLFEQSTNIGGRMVLSPGQEFGVSVHAEDVAGGCLGHNRLFADRAKSALGVKFGMNGAKLVKGKKDGVGFWDGGSMVAEMKRPRGEIGWALWAKLVWKYGASFWGAGDLPTGTMKGWRSFLDKGDEFDGLGDWITGRGVSGAVSLGAKERLEKNGIEGEYFRDILRAQVRRQSGCEVEEMSDLALSMALEREDEGLCVEGQGGRLVDVLEKFLGESKAKVRLDTKITGLKKEIIQESKEAWILELKGTGQKKMGYEVFDKVILAAPWNTSSLLSADGAEMQEQIVYHPLWVTLISATSKLDSSRFGDATSLPAQILPIQSPTLPQDISAIHEITHLRDIYSPAPPSSIHNSSLYRIFSSEPLHPETLTSIWAEGVEEVYTQKVENAYPMLYPRTDGFGKFKVGGGLWWTGGIEAVGSDVDGAWIVGEKVGGLVSGDIEALLKT